MNELDYYSLGAKQLAQHVGLTVPKVLAVVDYLGLKADVDCFKEFRIGSQLHKRYSQKALSAIRCALEAETAESIWNKQKRSSRGS